MNLASDEARDAVAEWLGNSLGGLLKTLGWLFTTFGGLSVMGGVAAIFVLWRLSLLLGPKKLCWRCQGSGHQRSWLGGRKVCAHCDGGLRKRVGAGDR